MIYVIIIGANIFGYFITVTGLPDALVNGLSQLAMPNGVIIFLTLFIYLILGSLFDELAAMLVTLPFVLPIIISMGYSTVWWGIINVVVIELGMITPPIGMNVFVLYGVIGNKVPLGTIYRGVMPFVLADVVRLSLLAFFPVLSLWLPRLLS
ncbi:TRAP transporter large permease subunit, partial [Thermodesulfobacteriota bacterium]